MSDTEKKNDKIKKYREKGEIWSLNHDAEN